MSRARLLLTLGLLAVATGLISLGLVQRNVAAETVVEVGMGNGQAPFRWQPAGMTVLTGTTVRWTVAGPAPHTVTSDGCGDPQAGACTFDSGTTTLLQAGTPTSSFTYTFNTPGVYRFYCRLHGTPGGVGQSGTVVVYEAGKAPPAITPGRPEQIQPSAQLSVLSPQQGQTIAGDRVEVRLGVQGATLRASVPGITDPRFGHYHLILDTTIDMTEEVPRVAPGVFHVSTDSFTLEGVRPGPHTLTVLWGFDNHYPSIRPIFTTINFTTTAPGVGITPPSTGDYGLRTPHRTAGNVAIFAGLTLFAGAAFALALRRSNA